MDNRRHFNTTERPQDKSKDCDRVINDLELFTWNELLTAFQIHDSLIHQGVPKISWCNGQHGHARRLAKLDRLYMPSHNRLGIHQRPYFIHGYTVGADYVPVQLEISFGNGEVRSTAFKWNVSHLQGKIIDMFKRAGIDARITHPSFTS